MKMSRRYVTYTDCREETDETRKRRYARKVNNIWQAINGATEAYKEIHDI